MEKSSFQKLTPSSSASASASSDQKKTGSSPKNKPAERAPLGNFVQKQATVMAKRDRYSSQKTTRFTNADDRSKDKINPRWAPVSPRTQAKPRVLTNQNPLILRSPLSSDFDPFVELESESNAFANDSSAAVPTTNDRPLERANENSPLLEEGDSFSTAASDAKSEKKKLPKLIGLPKFGALNSPRSKIKSAMPNISRITKIKSSKQREEQFPLDEDNPFSPYDIARAKAANSTDDITATIILPDASAENIGPFDLASILARFFGSPNEKGKSIDLRIMNILYCATGGPSALEKSDSYPEIGACAEFLSKGQDDPLATKIYMNALFTALMPHLNKKLRKELETAYLENQEGRLPLQKCLEAHLGLKPSFEEASIELDENLVVAPITMKPPAAPHKAIQVTMDNLSEVFQKTADVTEETRGRRAMNLVYCAAGGPDAINKPELCPETGAFAQSLTDLPNQERWESVEGIIKRLGRELMPLNVNRIRACKDLDELRKLCERSLSIF